LGNDEKVAQKLWATCSRRAHVTVVKPGTRK
jgi:hypothetical protein